MILLIVIFHVNVSIMARTPREGVLTEADLSELPSALLPLLLLLLLLVFHRISGTLTGIIRFVGVLRGASVPPPSTLHGTLGVMNYCVVLITRVMG